MPMEIRRIHSRAHDGSSQLEATANLVWFHCGSDFTSCKISLKSAIISTVVLPRSLTLGGVIREVRGFEATLFVDRFHYVYVVANVKSGLE